MSAIYALNRVSAFKERPAPPPGQKTLAGFVRVKEEQQAADSGQGTAGAFAETAAVGSGDGRREAGSPAAQGEAGAAACTAPDPAAFPATAAGQAHPSASNDAPAAEAAAPQPGAAPQQQGSRQRSEPEWFVGGRNGDDGFASCAPGRSFAASKASLMGSSSQGSR